MNKLVIKYSIFVVIAITVNIVTQFTIDQIANSMDITKVFFVDIKIVSLGIGTLAGLIVKFFLDKKYIFNASFDNKNQTFGSFLLYSLMGLVTTIIFWGFELGAYAVFHSNLIKYLAGIIGLIIGYYTKYHLDKKFVFSAHMQNGN